MPQPQQQFEDLPISQRIVVMQRLAAYPALTVMVFLRRGLGYRLLNPLSICAMTALMFVVAEFAKNSPNPDGLQLFAIFVFIAGAAQRWKSWREMRRGVRRHTYYIGDSIFEFRWLPSFLLRNRRIPRLFDPLICFVICVPILTVSPVLGAWIGFSGMCLRIFEDAVYKAQLERDMDTLDGMIVSEAQSARVEQFSEIDRHRSPDMTGVPTGLAPDVERKIRKRKDGTNPNPPRR